MQYTQTVTKVGHDLLLTITNQKGEVLGTQVWKGAARYCIGTDQHGKIMLSVPLTATIEERKPS